MPVTAELIENNSIVVTTISEPWTMQELGESIAHAGKLREETPHRLHAILDLTNMKQFPREILRSRSAGAFTHARHGQVVVVGADFRARRLLETMGMLTHIEAKFYDKFDEAIRFLKTADDNAAATAR